MLSVHSMMKETSSSDRKPASGVTKIGPAALSAFSIFALHSAWRVSRRVASWNK